MFDLVTFAGIFVAIGHDSNGTIECTSANGLCPTSTVPLGTWKNFPVTCSLNDACELFFNTSYRQVITVPTSSGTLLSASLEAGCITPSTSLGAFLQLQYANYSLTTHVNTTNFVNIGAQLPVDNSATWPCPGNIIATSGNFPVIAATSTAFVLRVIGGGGIGAPDSPRFSSVTVQLSQTVNIIYWSVVTARSTTSFSYRILRSIVAGTAPTISISWIATNQTSTICGAGDLCLQSGTSSCILTAATSACPTTTVTFGTAFTGTPNVVTNVLTIVGTVVTPLATVGLYHIQTSTV